MNEMQSMILELWLNVLLRHAEAGEIDRLKAELKSALDRLAQDRNTAKS